MNQIFIINRTGFFGDTQFLQSDEINNSDQAIKIFRKLNDDYDGNLAIANTDGELTGLGIDEDIAFMKSWTSLKRKIIIDVSGLDYIHYIIKNSVKPAICIER